MTLSPLFIWVLVFCLAAYGFYWVCQHFGLPKPVWWICGAILLIVLLVFLLRQIGAPVNPSIPIR